MATSSEPMLTEACVEPLPDDAIVVRGGLNRPQDIAGRIDEHPSGVVGASVQRAPGLSAAELAAHVPHNQVGVTTVGEVRAAGGDVISTPGRSPHHATLTGLLPGRMSELLTPTRRKPLVD